MKETRPAPESPLGAVPGQASKAAGSEDGKGAGRDLNALFLEGQSLVERLEDLDSSTPTFAETIENGLTLFEVRVCR